MQFKYFSLFQLPDINKQIKSMWEEQSGDKKMVPDNPHNGSIRLQSLEIKNFKGVKHGAIELYPIGKKQTNAGKSNILALYGQNGSGKTSVIQVLYLLKLAMMGEQLPDEAGRLVCQGAETADIKAVFEYKREKEDITEYITYSFSIQKMFYDDGTETAGICDEVLSLCKRDATGTLIEKTRKLFDTNSKNKVLNTSVIEVDVHRLSDPEKTWKERFQIDDSWQCFRGNRDDAIRCGASILFYQDLGFLDIVNFGDPDDEIFALYPNRYAYLDLLSSFATSFLFIAGANLFDAFSADAAPLYLRRGYVETHQGDEVSNNEVLYLARCLVPLNKVLSAIVPGLKVEIKPTFKAEVLDILNGDIIDEPTKELFSKTITELESIVQEITSSDDVDVLKEYDNIKQFRDIDSPFRDDTQQKIFNIQFFTRRGDTITPLEDESEGIKHIIYDLDLFIAAYNDPSVTVAIDEFDAGIFEYLLGEMLKTFEQHGKGQLIFTSHNLRPLEVLDRSFICFTTTNPDNRYLRMKYINQTNNLRDVYYRQILVGEQDEDLYDYVDSFELKEALDWAGEGNG